MYKKQMILQRIVCYATLVAAALVFFYSLGMVTDMYDAGFAYWAENLKFIQVAGTEIYYNIQEFNRQLTTVGIWMMIIALTQFLFQTHNRRKYYIANYISIVANTVVAIGASVWALKEIMTYKAQYLLVDFETLAEKAEIYGFEYIDSTFCFDIASVVFGIVLIVAVLNVANLIFKLSVMKAEKNLLAGKGV